MSREKAKEYAAIVLSPLAALGLMLAITPIGIAAICYALWRGFGGKKISGFRV